MNARQVSYRLIVCAIILYSATVTASQYADYSRRPLSEMLEVYSKFEASFQAGSNYNVGAAAALMANIGQKGGREVLPFLTEKSFDPETHELIRSAAAEAYVDIASVEECIEFMRKAFGINDDEGYWRSRLTPLFLEKMEAAIANRSVPDETMERLLSLLMAHTQTTSYSREASWVDDFLVKHCYGYRMSEQRLSLWSRILDEDKENELKRKNYLPIREAIEAIPPRKRTDLRKRFPDLPPLPDDAPARSPVKVAIAVAVGFVALAVCAVAAWLAARRRRVRETT